MDEWEVRDMLNGVRKEVCRRLGHDFGRWVAFTDPALPRSRTCKTCGKTDVGPRPAIVEDAPHA